MRRQAGNVSKASAEAMALKCPLLDEPLKALEGNQFATRGFFAFYKIEDENISRNQ
ncbi:hypothetical protein [Blastopirellula marina]|uniref:hypothetical protein n=1 Tax=Blastopirellula marina TaxID=124 RepID=UPI0012B64717|nr:hypothetical protein [Blastopirellula marina]